MTNDGSGCAGTILGGVLLALVLAVAVSMTGLPAIDAGSLSWDTSATDMRQQTERLRIQEEQTTERLRIEENADTQRTWALVIGLVAVVGTAAAGAAYIARQHAQRPVVVQPQLPPVEVRVLLPHLPGYRAEIIDGEWAVANDAEWMRPDDARRLITMR